MERKKLLLVEDESNILRMLEKGIGPSVEIVRVRAVDEALGAVEEEGPFHCFVVDLQIIPKGLTFDEMADYQDREGYAFLKKFWEDKSDKEIASLKSKTIICSGFISEFKTENKGEFNELALVDKTKGFDKKVVSLVKKIMQ